MKLSYSSERLRGIYYALPAPLRDAGATSYSVLQHRARFGDVFHTFLKRLERGWARSEAEAATAQVSRLQRVLSYAGERPVLP